MHLVGGGLLVLLEELIELLLVNLQTKICESDRRK